MTLKHAAFAFSLALAIAVPLAALMAACGSAPQGVVAPFGWIRLAVVHLLTLLPASVMGACLLTQIAGRCRYFLAIAAFAIALAVAWASVEYGDELERQLDVRTPSFVGRLLLRVLWCAILQFPWCVLGATLLGATNQRPGPALALSGVVAVLFPAIYANSLVAAQVKLAEEELRSGRWVRATPIIVRLCDVGSSRTVNKLTPANLRPKLERDLRKFTAEVAQPLSEMATVEMRREYARKLSVLDRLQEADRVLAPIAVDDSASMLLRALVLQTDLRWDESSNCYRAALVMLDKSDVANRVKAYDGLAFNARERKAFVEAEAIYAEALEAIPEAKAHFHFQLGRHCEICGRPAKALEHLQLAVTLAPTPYQELAAPLIEKLALATPGCLLRPALRMR